MPAEITVGQPMLTINQNSTFMVTDLNGEISAESEHGIFAEDTRFVSYYAIFANGVPWTRLNSSVTAYYAARIYATNQDLFIADGVVAAGTVGLAIVRTVGECIHEDIDITNHNLMPVTFALEIALQSDFADLFEVKAHKFVRRGHITTTWNAETSELSTSYRSHDFQRQLVFRLLNSGSRAYYANGRIAFEIALAPGATWHTCAEYHMLKGEHPPASTCLCFHDVDHSQLTEQDHLQEQWCQNVTHVNTSNEEVYRFYHQSVEDLGALRLHDYDLATDAWVPAAGVPWFVTIFGRDSLIVSLQSLWLHQGLACGSLAKLAQLQATTRDDARDAEPGKMPHEIRFGELAHDHLIPHTPYYGTADATPLYLILLHETWKWLGDDQLLHRSLEVAQRCLDWIDQSGDLDGDGFQEYQTRSTRGYENMGWKDAGDAVVYPDGRQVHGPKALCELQGYAYDAWLRMAEVFEVLGEPDRAHTLRNKAATLQAQFIDRFWCDDLGTYAYALDGNKQQVRTIASNAGHCLWSGIALPEHARRIVERFAQPDMWSGWGIRTLSALNPAYNPFSYQLGSVWPHDNGIIACGYKRYGFDAQAAAIAHDVSEAGACFLSHRVPELYAGIARQPGTFPIQYLGANIPQAWAAGSIFHLLQAMLGLQADAPHQRLLVDPSLPDWLPDVSLCGLKVGQARVSLRFWREGENSRWETTDLQGNLAVVEQPAQATDAGR